MENLVFETGGRPLFNDDFEVLQSETYYAIFSQFLELPPCVVTGCAVRDLGAGLFEVGAGLVFMEAALYRFDGAASVALPLELRLGAAVVEQRAYQSGGSKGVTSERKLEAQAVSPAPGARLLVTADGALRFEKAREAVVREVGELSFFTILAAQYDADGRGRYGTKAHGWQLLNGKNSQPNAAGKSFVGAGAGAGNEYLQLLATGGSKTSKIEVLNLPPHAHDIDTAGSHTHNSPTTMNDSPSSSLPATSIQYSDPKSKVWGKVQIDAAGDHSHTMQNTGGGQPLDTRDPFLAVGARVWVGLL